MRVGDPIFLWFAVDVLRQKDEPKRLPYPPGPPPAFFLGNALELPDIRKGHHVDLKFLEWSKEYGTVFTVYLPVVGPMIVCADPDMAKHIAVKKNFPKSFTYKNHEPIFGSRSILTAHGQDWMDKRRAFNPGFAPSFLRGMVSVLCYKVDRLVACLDKDVKLGRETHTLSRMQTFSSDVIVQIAFGEDWGGDTDSPHPARLWLTELMELTALSGNDPVVRYFDVRTWMRIRKLQSMLDDRFRKILERRLLAGDQNEEYLKENSSGRQVEPGSILSIAINQMRQKDGSLTNDDKVSILHQLKTFYMAGHDTTATLIAWTVWLLSQNRDILERLRGELNEREIWNDDKCPTYDQLQQCTFLEAVLNETLQLYPPGATARYTDDISQTSEDYTIGRAILYVSPYVMHRHPANFDKPDDFVPDRFLNNKEDLNNKWIPFLRGPRDCLGKYFAMLEAKVAVSRLTLRYDFEATNPNDNICYRITSLPRDGAKVKMTLRKSSQPGQNQKTSSQMS